MKLCTTCGETKPLSAFNKQTKSKDGLQHYCRTCSAMNKWRYRYGMTLADYQTRLSAQNYRCPGCGVHQDDYAERHKTHTRLVVDHDHETDRVRGLLCNNCNIAIGAVHDNIETLQNLIVYLKSGDDIV